MLLTRSAMLETLGEDYILTARAKGLPRPGDPRSARRPQRHAPGDHVTSFSFPGLRDRRWHRHRVRFLLAGDGLAAPRGIRVSDIPLAAGILAMTGVLALFGHLVADVLYTVLDPEFAYREGTDMSVGQPTQVRQEEPAAGRTLEHQPTRLPSTSLVVKTPTPLWRVRLRLFRRLSPELGAVPRKQDGDGRAGPHRHVRSHGHQPPDPDGHRVGPGDLPPRARPYDAVLTEFTVVEEVTDETTEIELNEARHQAEPDDRRRRSGSDPGPAGTAHPGPARTPLSWAPTPGAGHPLPACCTAPRAAFFLGVVAALTSVVIATTVGSVAAYFGGWIDGGLMRLRRPHPPHATPSSAHRHERGVETSTW